MTNPPAAAPAEAGDAATQPEIRIEVLGPLRVERQGERVEIPPGLPTRLLALLALGAERPTSVERLIDDLWETKPPSRPQDSIYALMRDLRQAIGGSIDPITSRRGHGYQLTPAAVSTDAADFRQAAAVAKSSIDGDEDANAEAALRDGLSLWRDHQPFPEIASLDGARGRVAELKELRRWCLHRRLTIDLSQGRHADAVPELRALVEEYPYDQQMWATLMRALSGSGRMQEADEAYHRLRSILNEEFGDEPLPELRELDLAILRQDPAVVRRGSAATSSRAEGRQPSTASATPADHRHNLPALVNGFLGRSADVERLLETTKKNRLVTVVGPGGAGKSRLVTETAVELVGNHPGGVWLIDVSQVSSRTEIVERLGEILNRRSRNTDRLLLDCALALNAAPTLLVFDGAEHNIEVIALLAASLLTRAPDLDVIVTSRAPLLLPGETTIQLEPLAVLEQPTPDTVIDLRAGEADVTGIVADRSPMGDEPSHAARLFVERARSADPSFSPGTTAVDVIERICARLDGLPLAIELVAPLVAVLALDDVLASLNEHLELDVNQRGSVGHHRTLRQAIDWSVERLRPDERDFLIAVGAFPGRFGLTAAAAVADVSEIEAARHLATLVRSSLLKVVRENGDIRGYRLLETIRTYCRSSASASGIDVGLSKRHLDAVAAAADQLRPLTSDMSSSERIVAIQSAMPNYRSAVEWGIRAREDAQVLDIIHALTLDMHRLALPAELPVWLDAIDGSTDDESTCIAKVAQTTLAFTSGDYRNCRRFGEQAVTVCRVTANQTCLARSLMFVAAAAAMEGDIELAVGRALESQAISETIGDRWVRGWSMCFESLAQRRGGDLDRAETVANQALRIFDELGDEHGCVFPLMTLGRIVEARGRVDDGVALIDAARSIADRIEDGFLTSLTLNYLGLARYRQGDWVAAAADLDRCLALTRTNPHRVITAGAIEHLAAMGAAQRELPLAVRLCGFTQRYRGEIPANVKKPEALGHVLDTALVSLHDGDRDELLDTGAHMTLDEAVGLAQGIAARVRQRLSVTV